MGVWAAYLVHRPAYRGWKTGLTVSWLSIGSAQVDIVSLLRGAMLVMAAPMPALATLGPCWWRYGEVSRTLSKIPGAMVLAIRYECRGR